MFISLRRSFKSEYIHIGMDEAHMLGLGKFLDKHGYQNRFEILCRHLEKVTELAKKYNFKPIMWSDMFFRLGNGGRYCSKDPKISDDVIAITPTDVGLVYWDYYSTDKEQYDAMIAAHKRFKNELWFAGGAWTWAGLSSGNKKTMDTMIPAMLAAKDAGVENVFMTMWGDNGKECSFYSVLPALYALRRAYDGECDMEKIKAEFAAITGESFDDLYDLDLINFVGCNTDGRVCIGKTMLYNDPFLGFFDSGVREGAAAEYASHASRFRDHAAKSKSYSYIFEMNAALCDVLAIKYDLGARVRAAYQKNERDELAKIAEEFRTAEELLEVFHDKFSILWHKENKPHGFEVQDQRIGGLIMRLKSCRKRLVAYLEGKESTLPELEEQILDWFGGKTDFRTTEYPARNVWTYIVSPSAV
jgi:hypothetical protein